MDNDVVKRLAWSGLVAAVGAASSWLSFKVAGMIWRRVFDEDPPA